MSEQLDLFDAPIPKGVERLTVNQALRLFVDLYWKKKAMYKDTRCFIRYLTSYYDGRFIDELGRLDITNMRRDFAKAGFVSPGGLGISALNKCHMIMANMFNRFEEFKEDVWAGGYNFSGLMLPRRNPAQLVKKDKEPAGDRFMQPWEARKLRKYALAIGDDDLGDRILMGIWCRLSPIDLNRLNDDEIKTERWQIEVRRRHTITEKNPKGCLQVIPLKEKIWALIERRRRVRSQVTKDIFNKTNLRRRLMKLRKYAISQGMRDFTIRDFRRSGSGYLHEKGVDMQTRADGLGHKSQRITQDHYTPPTKPHLKKSTEMLVDAF